MSKPTVFHRRSVLYYKRLGVLMRTGEVAAFLGITSAEVRRLGMLTDGLQPANCGENSRTRKYSPTDVLAYADRNKA